MALPPRCPFCGERDFDGEAVSSEAIDLMRPKLTELLAVFKEQLEKKLIKAGFTLKSCGNMDNHTKFPLTARHYLTEIRSVEWKLQKIGVEVDSIVADPKFPGRHKVEFCIKGGAGVRIAELCAVAAQQP